MRTIRSAIFELVAAIRSRRAIVLIVLYVAMSLIVMNGAISVLAKIESPIADVLQVEKTDGRTGAVSAAIWQSKSFQRRVRAMVRNPQVYDDLVGKHPAELVFAWIVFMAVPFLALFVSSRRIADEVKSGAAKYMLLRVTRLEYSMGKYLGIALMILIGLMLGALAAWAVAAIRIYGADIGSLLPSMLMWAVKAWFLSLAWLGLGLGVSHICKSGAKADAISLMMMLTWAILPLLINAFATGPISEKFTVLVRLFPSSVSSGLWRSSFMPVTASALWLVMLGLFWFSIGHIWFAKRDVR
jgi:ABC-type transport system involved in multi-copper enzyme maturation permease subunit